MDCDDNGGMKPWNWQPGEDSYQKDNNFDISPCIWTEVVQNEEDISYMFDETTPVKACGDLVAYNAAGTGTGTGNTSKEIEQECTQSYPPVKRRRMLQFDSQQMDASLCCDETASAFLRPDERENSVEEVLADGSQCNSRQQVSCDDGDQSTDTWLANCLNDTDMLFAHDDVNNSDTSTDVQIDISEFWNDQPNPDISRDQQQVIRTPQKIVFRGRKSFMRPPPKLASSVAYPFAFIKPCGVHGGVTLKDINQRIQTPLPQKKQSDEDPFASYPTSAFSGKPVVGKMKIRTEGGKGSITVMRTKG